MKRSEALALAFALALSPGSAFAQGGTELPEGHPAPTGGRVQQGADPRMQQMLRPPPPVPAQESSEVPQGTIRVLVVDPAGQPVADQAVDVGSLASGERQRYNERTNAEGVATFSDLPVGTAQHYRVNVPYEGATYSTMPFALPTNGNGYAVRVVRQPVTRDASMVFFHVFRTVVEQRGERMHVIHQTELTNAGQSTYVFPEEGVRGALPEGALAFQFQRVITDQRIEELDGEDAYAIRGSLPPGTVQLAFAYDLEIDGTELDVPVDIPLPFFGMQVIVEALPDLEVRVAGQERLTRLDQQGEACESSEADPSCAWILAMRRSPSDTPIDHLDIHISGIPGPGPMRKIASGVFVLFMLAGVVLLVTARRHGSSAEAREARREAIREESEQLAEELEAGEVGPEFAARRKAELVRELAGLYYADEVETEQEEAEERRGTRQRRLGPAGLLFPAADVGVGVQVAEAIMTLLSLPLLLLTVMFLGVRPRALRAYGGHGEIVISVVLGAASLGGLWILFDFAEMPMLQLAGLAALSGFGLVMRLILRQAPAAEKKKRSAA